jgi:hypothetical protein
VLPNEVWAKVIKRRSLARCAATNLHTGCCFAHRIVRDDRSMSVARLFAFRTSALETYAGSRN